VQAAAAPFSSDHRRLAELTASEIFIFGGDNLRKKKTTNPARYDSHYFPLLRCQTTFQKIFKIDQSILIKK
jgi:hypothetical protein